MLKNQYLRGIKLKRDDVPTFKKYPFNLPILKTFEELSFHSKVTFLIGENGMGKSTLLEAIAIALGFNPEGGSLNFHFSTYDKNRMIHHLLNDESTNKFQPCSNIFLYITETVDRSINDLFHVFLLVLVVDTPYQRPFSRFPSGFGH